MTDPPSWILLFPGIIETRRGMKMKTAQWRTETRVIVSFLSIVLQLRPEWDRGPAEVPPSSAENFVALLQQFASAQFTAWKSDNRGQ